MNDRVLVDTSAWVAFFRGQEPTCAHVVDLIAEGRCDLVINTPTGSGARDHGYEIWSFAVRNGVPSLTTMTGASGAVRAIIAQQKGPGEVYSLQELHAR